MMKKTKIKNSIFFLFVFSFFFFCKPVSASTINNINMDVFLDQKGNASVIETWKASLYEGTEGYKGYTKLGNARIKNFSVEDDTGRFYDSIYDWNISASFEEKKYKSGILEIPDGVELCWGISNYGNRTYTLKYEIENFVIQYRDRQGIYFNFLNLDQEVGQAKITIHSDTSFSSENAKIWSFGYDGRVEFENGNIVLYPTKSLKKSQYMVGLVQFQENIFQTTNQSTQSFDDIYDLAFADAEEQKRNSIIDVFLTILWILIGIITNPVIIIIFCVYLISKDTIKKKKKPSFHLDFRPYGKKLPNDDEIDYFREIPCDKVLERAYFVAYHYHVISEITLNRNIMGAYLLKWIRDGLVEVIPTKSGLFDIKENHYAFRFKNIEKIENVIEKELLNMFTLATGENEILEAKEFDKWSKRNYQKIDDWFLLIQTEAEKQLEQQGLIVPTETEKKRVSKEVKEEAIHLKGLKKFLLDFSLMPEREYFEVTIWEEYLIFAQLMGIAKKVEKQFHDLWKDFSNQTILTNDTITIVANNMSNICYRNVIRKTTPSYNHSSISGGGGSSFSSGGSSAGGSSGGGFR